MSKCMECDDAEASHPDPRTPPLEVGNEVLCDDCRRSAVEDVIEELEGVLEELRAEVEG